MSENPKKMKRCFVISPIGDEGNDIRRAADMVLRLVVEDGLRDLAYEIRRADAITTPGMINDQVIQSILDDDLVVADLTNQNPNVFYELGLRHAAGKATVHLCADGTKIPFDNAGHRTIFYRVDDVHSLEKAARMLRTQAIETEHHDFTVSNPVTQARAHYQMSQSTDSKDQVIAEMNTRLQRLESESVRGRIAEELGRAGSQRDPFSPDESIDEFFVSEGLTKSSDEEQNKLIYELWRGAKAHGSDNLK